MIICVCQTPIPLVLRARPQIRKPPSQHLRVRLVPPHKRPAFFLCLVVILVFRLLTVAGLLLDKRPCVL